MKYLSAILFVVGLVLCVVGNLKSIHSLEVAGIVVSVVSLAAVMIALAKTTDIVRDVSKATVKPYSLARTQLAFWSVVVVSTYVLIWTTTGSAPDIPDSVLGLLGISMGTTAAARLIDSADDKTSRHQNGESDGFLTDIISDANGVSVHRFQTVVWIVVLGAIFVQRAFSDDPALMEFTGTQLGLLGISNGAYLGLKLPENNPANQSPSSSQAAASPGGGQAAPPTTPQPPQGG